MLEKLSPIMPSANINATEAFYSRLGFHTVYKDPASYLLMKREAVEAHFFHKPAHDKWTCDHGAYLRPSDIGALSNEWSQLELPHTGIPRFEPAADKTWGMRELALLDLDGNLIRAGQELPNG